MARRWISPSRSAYKQPWCVGRVSLNLPALKASRDLLRPPSVLRGAVGRSGFAGRTLRAGEVLPCARQVPASSMAFGEQLEMLNGVVAQVLLNRLRGGGVELALPRRGKRRQ